MTHRKTGTLGKLQCALTVVVGTAFLGAATIPAHAGVVEDRQANFKRSESSMRAAGQALRAGDFDALARHVEPIADWAKAMPGYFPEGSGGGSDALPSIWEDFDGFEMAAMANHDAVRELIEAAATRDAGKVQQAMRAVGGTCKSCHRRFRKR